MHPFLGCTWIAPTIAVELFGDLNAICLCAESLRGGLSGTQLFQPRALDLECKHCPPDFYFQIPKSALVRPLLLSATSREEEAQLSATCKAVEAERSQG